MDQAAAVRRRRMSSAPASRATPPITASSSTSAPVKGRLEVPAVLELGVVDVPAATGSPLLALVWVAATVGTTSGQFGVTGVIDADTVGDVVV